MNYVSQFDAVMIFSCLEHRSISITILKYIKYYAYFQYMKTLASFNIIRINIINVQLLCPALIWNEMNGKRIYQRNRTKQKKKKKKRTEDKFFFDH